MNTTAPAMRLPEIPESDPHVEFYAMQCRTCDVMGPWLSVTDGDSTAHLWDTDHAQGTGHKRFYRWSVTRNTASVA